VIEWSEEMIDFHQLLELKAYRGQLNLTYLLHFVFSIAHFILFYLD